MATRKELEKQIKSAIRRRDLAKTKANKDKWKKRISELRSKKNSMGNKPAKFVSQGSKGGFVKIPKVTIPARSQFVSRSKTSGRFTNSKRK